MAPDPLFSGATRPETFYGVPYGPLMIGFLCDIVALAITGNIQWLLVMFPYSAVLWVLASDDPRVFRYVQLWLITKLRPAIVAKASRSKVLTWTNLPRRRY